MDLRFSITSYDDGLAYGTLSWPGKKLSTGAASGPYGRKELPLGLYHIKRADLLDKNGQPPYCDSLQQCWMQVIRPQFSTARTDLGIHPDGNKQGTLGCIGLFDADTSAWYEAFRSVPATATITLEVV
jgi:hypothetical protein